MDLATLFCFFFYTLKAVLGIALGLSRMLGDLWSYWNWLKHQSDSDCADRYNYGVPFPEIPEH